MGVSRLFGKLLLADGGEEHGKFFFLFGGEFEVSLWMGLHQRASDARTLSVFNAWAFGPIHLGFLLFRSLTRFLFSLPQI